MSRVFALLLCCLKIWILLVFSENCSVLNASQTRSSIATITSWRSLITRRQIVADLLGPYANFSIINGPPKCVQLQCKIICVRTHIKDLIKNIDKAMPSKHNKCTIIEELCLYHNVFPQQKIFYGFLGVYSNRVRSLYIGKSNVTDIEEAAFRDGIFKEIYLEDLQLQLLSKDIFANISNTLNSFSMIQHEMAVSSVQNDFLDYVKYKLRNLTLQVGLRETTNITSANSLLYNLKYVDLRYNNFTNNLCEESFQKLWIVQDLDLSHANIETLPFNVFSPLTDTLLYLNISYNKLLTLNHIIFGRHPFDEALIIDMQHNPWYCSCELRKELAHFLKQTHANNIICQTPVTYKGLSIWDESLCANELSESLIEKTNGNELINALTTESLLTLIPTKHTGSNIYEDNTILLQCHTAGAGSLVQWKQVLWSDTYIHLTALPKGLVAVYLEFEEFEEDYGVIWFSKVVDDYYNMAVNYDQYGLGCIGPIDYLTNIGNLEADTTYTFCLIGQNQLRVPPFHCASVHLRTNLGMNDANSVRRNSRTVRILLITLGVVLTGLLGITGIYKLLQYKPTLLKGSERIITPCRNSLNVVVLPKKSSLARLQLKEDTLAKQNAESFSTFYTVANNSTARSSSFGSVAGSQSYINVNLYEVIPAYLRLQGTTSSQMIEKSEDLQSSESSMPSLSSKPEYYCDESLVSYAEVSPRSKRASNDPLPALPADGQKEMPASIGFTSAHAALPLRGGVWSINVSDAVV